MAGTKGAAQAESNLQRYPGMALLGLLFTVFGVAMLIAFLASVANIQFPEFLEINSPNYNYLLMGVVFVIASIGLLHRITRLWSITIIFIIIVIVGNALGLFFDGPMRIIMIVVFAIALVYILMERARNWYGLE